MIYFGDKFAQGFKQKLYFTFAILEYFYYMVTQYKMRTHEGKCLFEMIPIFVNALDQIECLKQIE